MNNRQNDFYRLTRMVRETGSPNSICTGYDENEAVFVDESGAIRFHRLHSLEKELSETFPSYSFCAYTSNQRSRNHQQTEVEVYVHRGNNHYFVSFNTSSLEHQQVVNVHLYVLDVEQKIFHRIKEEPSDHLLYDVKERVYDYLQDMPAYRLWFATQDITLWE